MIPVIDRPRSFLIFGGHRTVRHYNTLYRHHPCFCFHKNEHTRRHGNGDGTDILSSIKEYFPLPSSRIPSGGIWVIRKSILVARWTFKLLFCKLLIEILPNLIPSNSYVESCRKTTFLGKPKIRNYHPIHD